MIRNQSLARAPPHRPAIPCGGLVATSTTAPGQEHRREHPTGTVAVWRPRRGRDEPQRQPAQRPRAPTAVHAPPRRSITADGRPLDLALPPRGRRSAAAGASSASAIARSRGPDRPAVRRILRRLRRRWRFRPRKPHPFESHRPDSRFHSGKQGDSAHPPTGGAGSGNFLRPFRARLRRIDAAGFFFPSDAVRPPTARERNLASR